MVVPNLETGLILFRAIKLGFGTMIDPTAKIFTPFGSGALGFKLDEYEIEMGSLLFGNINHIVAYPNFTFKIRPVL